MQYLKQRPKHGNTAKKWLYKIKSLMQSNYKGRKHYFVILNLLHNLIIRIDAETSSA
jgi:hypothetical protein